MMPYRLGLTGSIGMGKSTTAKMFAEQNIPVWDADAAVHRLYEAGGEAVAPLSDVFPHAIRDGAVDRSVLKEEIAKDPSALKELERIVHPLVAADRETFASTTKSDIVVFDIPLLFERNSDELMDATLLVTAPAEIQRARVLARPGMTEEQFNILLARQMPDAEKRARATHIVETLSLDQTKAYVLALIAHLRKRIEGRNA